MPETPASAIRFVRLTATLRAELLATLTDEELSFALPGNPTIGAVLEQLAATQQSYIECLRTEVMTWALVEPLWEGHGGVERMTRRFTELDAAFEAVLESISDDVFRDTRIDHGGGYVLPIRGIVHTWVEALVIVYGRLDVYLRAMGRPRSEQWVDWIG